jgi:very-short-patch-repair endonuclease
MCRESAAEFVDITVVGRGAHAIPGVRIHRIGQLRRQDVRRRAGLPLTSPGRTLLDLAGQLDSLELEGALATARRLRLVTDNEIAATLASAPASKAGVARLRALLAQKSARDTRSGYERRLLKLIEWAQLPSPVTNVTVAGHLVDMYWPQQRLVLEFDSWTYHHDRRAFERDRLRDQRITAGGDRVTRVTARQVDETPYATVARLAASLAQPAT